MALGRIKVRRHRVLCVVVLMAGQLLGGTLRANAIELRGDLSLLGQVREGDNTRETEAPNDLYGDLGVNGMPFGSSVDTFFRLERDFGIDDGASDFYAGSIRVPGAIPGIDMTLGRQFVSQGPSGVFVADAAKMSIDPGWPVAFTMFGGAPRYFEPTVNSKLLSRDETIWGGSMRAARWKGTDLSIGYFGLERDDHVLRQLMNASLRHSFLESPGLPTIYGNIAYDPDHQNLDLASAGVNLMVPQAQLRFNFEGTYYKPQDHEHDRPLPDFDKREDALFEAFANSELVQWRGGVSHSLTPELTAVADYSFQRYAQQEKDQYEISHIASAGLVWLPGGDGLELVKLQYYVIDGDGGSVNGGKVYYENHVYEQFIFRTKLDFSGYEKENHQSDVAISSLLGLGYVILPGLVFELNVEANHNDRFDEDYRFGFVIDYKFRHRISRAASGSTAS